MNSTHNKARYILLLKTKQQHKSDNRAGKQKAARNQSIPGGRWPPRPWQPPRAGRGGLWLARLLRSSNAAFCASFWFAGFALDLPSWAYWASFATSLDLVWPQFLYFLLFGLTCTNLQSKPEQA